MSQRSAVASETRGGAEIFTLSEGDGTHVVIVPAWGNNCFSFQTRESILEPVPFDTFRQRPTSYGIPILFPFPNRIQGGAFTFCGKHYVVNPERHGFVRDKQWQVVNAGASAHDGAWLTSQFDATQYAEQILQQFPFPFCLNVTYRLQSQVLHMQTTVQNTGSEVMPFGFGIHPYFQRPKHGTVLVPAQKRWELQDSLPTGNLLGVEGLYDLRQPRDVSQLVLDDIFTDLRAGADDLVRCVLDDHQRGTQTIVAFDAAQFPHVVVYTPPAPRRAICIEPYTCPTDAFNLQQQGIESNLLVLQPGECSDFKIVTSVTRVGT